MCLNRVCKKESCDIPHGKCHCGCGETPNRSLWNRTNPPLIRGEYHLYTGRHSARMQPSKEVKVNSPRKKYKKRVGNNEHKLEEVFSGMYNVDKHEFYCFKCYKSRATDLVVAILPEEQEDEKYKCTLCGNLLKGGSIGS